MNICLNKCHQSSYNGTNIPSHSSWNSSFLLWLMSLVVQMAIRKWMKIFNGNWFWSFQHFVLKIRRFKTEKRKGNWERGIKQRRMNKKEAKWNTEKLRYHLWPWIEHSSFDSSYFKSHRSIINWITSFLQGHPSFLLVNNYFQKVEK